MAKVLVLDPVHNAGLTILREAPGIACVHLPEPTEPDIARHMADADALILRGRGFRTRCSKGHHGSGWFPVTASAATISISH